MPVPQSRNVIAVISAGGSRFKDIRLNIPRRGSIGELVYERLSEADRENFVGVMNVERTTWIDQDETRVRSESRVIDAADESKKELHP